ncbi:MAG: hypothetical protein ACR2JW_11140 [Thermomicrobiales bacterium]
MAEQLQQFTDPELEAALRALGPAIAYPPSPDLAASVRQRIAARPSPTRPGAHWTGWFTSPATRRRVAFALALLLVLALLLGAIPPVRKGVARRLGLQNVAIVNVTAVPTPVRAPTALPAPAPTPNATSATPPIGTGASAATPIIVSTQTPEQTPDAFRAALGTRTTITEAQSRVPFAIQTPGLPELGAPDEVYFQTPPPGGRVSLLYSARTGLPAITGTDVGLLIQQFRGGIQAGLYQKGVPPGVVVEPVTVNGVAGYWIAGGLRAFAYTDANGTFRYEDVRNAGNTLLWERDGIVYRLESALPKADALRIAASVR